MAASANRMSFQISPWYSSHCGVNTTSSATGTHPRPRGFSHNSASSAPSSKAFWNSRNSKVPGTTASNRPSSQAITGGCQLLYSPARPSANCATES